MNESPETTELKKPHASRLLGGVETCNRLIPQPRMVYKNLGGYLRSEESEHHSRFLIQCSVPGRLTPITSGCKNKLGFSQWENCWSPRQFLLKNLHICLVRLTPCGLQHWDSSLKGTHAIQGGTEVSGIKASRGHCPFSEPSPHRATELTSWCHI